MSRKPHFEFFILNFILLCLKSKSVSGAASLKSKILLFTDLFSYLILIYFFKLSDITIYLINFLNPKILRICHGYEQEDYVLHDKL